MMKLVFFRLLPCSVLRAQKYSTAFGALLATLGLVAISLTTAVATATAADWPMFGQNLSNTATNPAEKNISPTNASSLKLKWAFTTGGDVSARAAVVKGVVYFPDWGGNLWAVSAGNGKLIWSHQLSDYGLTGSFNGVYHSRTTPAVVKDTVYVGTQEGAWLLAIKAKTGDLIWKTQLESPTNDPFALITTSPAVSGDLVYTGVASLAEGGTLYGANLSTLSARGSVVAVNADTGAIVWKTYTVPEGYTGGGVWGSNFVVDVGRGTVFVSTGNNYSHPTDPIYLSCISGGGTAATCSSPNNYVDSILALDKSTGVVKWATKLVDWTQTVPAGYLPGSDDWNVDCLWPLLGFLSPGPQCPLSPTGPDYDFASAPNLITYKDSNNKSQTILGAGQKSGIYYALNPDTGEVRWQTQVGPGSALGGIEWGSASDGKRIYVAIVNLYGIPYAGGSAGSWAALDPATGNILWQKPEPNADIAVGPLSVANDVVYAPSMAGSATAQNMFALDAATGNTLWSFAAGSSVNAGATIVDGVVYWGSGYVHLGFPGQTGSVTTGTFYAFGKAAN